MHILDMIGPPQMNAPVTPTEKSQIVIAYTSPQMPLVVRFSSVKKGEAAYKAMRKAWVAWLNGAHTKPHDTLFDVNGDMFISCIDLARIASISFVDHVKREKFIPIQ